MSSHTHPPHDPHAARTRPARPAAVGDDTAATSPPEKAMRAADAGSGSVRTDGPYGTRTFGSALRQDAADAAAAARRAVTLTVRRRRERRRWGGVETLAGLGELTAQWLEGHLDYLPGYATGGPDEETLCLVPTLAALNRAGCVTLGSQPASQSPTWRQRAAVELITEPEPARMLAGAAETAGPIVIRGEAGWRMRWDRRVVVTQWDGRDHTWFGTVLSRRHLRDPVCGYGVCSRAAVAALCRAEQVTLIDPEWGRNDVLWPLLDEFTRTETRRRAGAEEGEGGGGPIR